MMNCDREDFLILKKGDYAGPVLSMCLLVLSRFWAEGLDWMLETSLLPCVCC